MKKEEQKELSSKFEGLIASWVDRIDRIHREGWVNRIDAKKIKAIEECISDLKREIRIIEADMILKDL